MVTGVDFKALNLGCGNRFFPNWENLDFNAQAGVRKFDLNKKLPFRSNTFDFVYHSHILEHFSRTQAIDFLEEILRVLKPNGIMRAVVPDLEQIAINYINSLNEVRQYASELNQANYNWSVIELIDQMTRTSSGGEMLKFWSQEKIVNEEYVQSRVGDEFTSFRTGFKNISSEKKIKDVKISKSISAKKLGLFKLSGECHQWMYDSYSLTQLLESVKFKHVSQFEPHTSNLETWSEFNWLDLEQDKSRKPDSIFIEGIK